MKLLKEQSSNGSDHNRYAAIYARLSTEDQADGYSLPTQVEASLKLAAREGFTVPESYIFQEDHTGKVLNRPILNRVRELAQQRAIQALIVYDPDRLARRFALQMILDEEFRQAGVDLLFVTHQVEDSPEGMLFFHMRGALAEYEREKIMERTRRGGIGRAKAGSPWGGQVPLGYRAIREPHKAHWEIEEEEASLVRRIFAMCLQGMTTYAIAEQLSQERVPTRRDRGAGGGGRRIVAPGIWNDASIHKILRNEAYTGRAYWGKNQRTSRTTSVRRPRSEWIEIPVPAMIDRATFDAAQHRLRRNQELSSRNCKHTYLLSGYLHCGRCGRRMTGTAPKGGGRYHCSSVHNTHDPHARCRGSMAAGALERQVWDAVTRLLEKPELIAAEVARQEAHAEEQRQGIHRELAAIDAALLKCDREAQRWADAYAGEVINLAELKAYRADIEKHRQSLLTQQAACQAKLEAIGQAVKQVEVLMGYCARVRQQLQTFDEAEKRRALEARDIRVRWTPGQHFTIEGSIPLDEIVPIASSCGSSAGRGIEWTCC
jgi:site-specific DNA recombinase